MRNPALTSRIILISILAAFLLLLAMGIRSKTLQAVAPPIYDPLTYYFRSSLVWQALRNGNLRGIFDGYLALRPPGTAFLLYPLGFHPSIHGFLFRAVFVPILLWALALVISISRLVRTRSDALLGSAFCLGLSSLPLFYHFEINPVFVSAFHVGYQWGMVDGLQASVAALATVLICWGVEKRRLVLGVLAWLLALLTFYVKPSGILVFGVIGIIGLTELLILFLRERQERRKLIVFCLQLFAIGTGISAVGLFVALRTGYMNRSTIGAAVTAQQILIAINSSVNPAELLRRFAQLFIGHCWFLPGVILIVCLLYRAFFSSERLSLALRLAAGAVIALAAVFWWLYLAGPDERYLLPFFLSLVAWSSRDLFAFIKGLTLAIKVGTGMYFLVPMLLLTVMLYQSHPPIPLQLFLGVNLSTGGYAEEVQEGKQLFAESVRIHRPLVLYTLGEWRTGVIEMIGWIKSMSAGFSNEFNVRRPLNWIEAPGLRIKDLVGCDYILIENVPPAMRDHAAVYSWRQEIDRFAAFAYRECGPDRNGLELVADGSTKILRVANAETFKTSLAGWINTIPWKDDFLVRNAGTW